mmetsp:Transcript_98046/g.277639  ORF Transcript_98046/g.277639 Transcript_98046/m.277639 type:complete len:206 (-) Transcript_98046:234-851(-)
MSLTRSPMLGRWCSASTRSSLTPSGTTIPVSAGWPSRSCVPWHPLGRRRASPWSSSQATAARTCPSEASSKTCWSHATCQSRRCGAWPRTSSRYPRSTVSTSRSLGAGPARAARLATSSRSSSSGTWWIASSTQRSLMVLWTRSGCPHPSGRTATGPSPWARRASWRTLSTSCRPTASACSWPAQTRPSTGTEGPSKRSSCACSA